MGYNIISTDDLSPLAKDVSGEVFGFLIAKHPTDEECDHGVKWLCECACGELTLVRLAHLTAGNIRSCGTCGKVKDISGQKFGKLTALSLTGVVKNENMVWECRCECGDITYVRSSSLTSSNTTSCGKGGPCSPNWQGGKTKEVELIRDSPKYDRWRRAVFMRDAYTCQSCGESGGSLHPHHILNFSQHPDYRFDVDNGVTLCKSCHIEFHKEYGQEYNDRLEIIDFLGGMI